jgi:hypothetical protein
MRSAADARWAQYVATTLDLVLGTARLASYFFMVGNLKEAEKHRAAAQRDYDALLLDWAAFDMDTHADDTLRQKRADVERCLKVLADGETC